MPQPLRLLIAEDSEDDALLIVRQIRRAGHHVEFQRVETAPEMAAAYDGGEWDLVISDVNMPGFGAGQALRLVRRRERDTPFIVVSGVIDEERAVTLLKAGAHDFVLKTNLARLVPAIERELRECEARRARHEAEEARRLSQQELLAAKEELENALAAKTRFLAAASHDLRQPFQSMRLYQHLLAESLTEPLQRKIVGNLGEAMAAGEALLHALLDISTLDAGIIPVNASDTTPLDVATAVVGEFMPEARSRGVRLKATGVRDGMRTDPTLLARMLRNLVSNALRYSADGGRVLVACRRTGEGLKIQVWDTGIGIPHDKQPTVFEDFVQLGNPERDRRQGLGLGLGVVRRMARLLDCSLELRSEPGRGSVFTLGFSSRLSPSPFLAAAPDAPDAADGGGGHLVLVIEDEEMQLTALQMMLETWGYDVLTARSGAEAVSVSRAAQRPPHVIVSDFRLPGEVDGVQAAAQVGRTVGRKLPTVIVTGDTDPARIREATRSGCRLLHKPYDPGALRMLLEDMIRQLPADRAAGYHRRHAEPR